MDGNTGYGMIPSGKYIHKSSGEIIYVRDSFQDGDKLIIMSDKGQLSMKEFSEYFQVEDGEDLYIPNLNDLYGEQTNKNQLLTQINQGLNPEDKIRFKNKNNNIIQAVDKELKVEQKLSNNKNYDLIKKVFDKYPVEKPIDFEIIEEEWPFKEFNMLVNILDVPLKDICDYIIDNYLDKDHLSKTLSLYFEKHI